MSLIRAITDEVADIIDVYTDDDGILDPMDTWDRNNLIKIKTLIDYVLMDKKVKESTND